MATGAGTALLVGGATLAGSIFVGKLVVDAVQGRMPEAATRGTLDESVRFVGSMLGLSLAILQLPRAYDAAQKLLNEGVAPALP